MNQPPDSNQPRSTSGLALAPASGLVFQLVGGVLAFGSCCWGSFVGRSDRLSTPADAPLPRNVAQLWRQEGAAPVLSMTSVCLSFTGGLALAALGLGLQAGRRCGATAAVCVTAVAVLYWLGFLAWAVLVSPAAGRIIGAFAMTSLWTVCLILAAVSRDELRRHPPAAQGEAPPPDRDIERLADRELPDDLRDAMRSGGPERED